MEGSSFWPLPLRRVENGRSLLPTESLSTCKQADCKKLKKGSWPVSHATLWLLLSNFSNDPLAALGDRRFKAKSDNIDKVFTATASCSLKVSSLLGWGRSYRLIFFTAPPPPKE